MAEVWHMRREIDAPFDNCSAHRKGNGNLGANGIGDARKSRFR